MQYPCEFVLTSLCSIRNNKEKKNQLAIGTLFNPLNPLTKGEADVKPTAAGHNGKTPPNRKFLNIVLCRNLSIYISIDLYFGCWKNEKKFKSASNLPNQNIL